MTESSKRHGLIHNMISALGLVFGDIGTSPIYTVTVIFLIVSPTLENVLGIISLIVWSLIILVSVGYAWLAMELNIKGEGGTIVLKEIVIKYLNKTRPHKTILLLTYIGISLLVGDGVITPAISILSAVEGLRIIPGLESISNQLLITIACVIAIGLFSLQRKGTERISAFFGPIMVIWFLALGLSGIWEIYLFPQILTTLSPLYGIRFLVHNGFAGFLILSEVILCSTGGEALYADMGHLGRKPIIHAWIFGFVMLVLNYLGQGAFIHNTPHAKNILFEMIAHQAFFLYVPFLVLSVIATVIASQAMISGMFSIVYQGISTRMMPLLKIDYTSNELKSQIYISAVNWLLLLCVLWIIVLFEESSKLAGAYGLAVTGTMTITGLMMIMVFYSRRAWFKLTMACCVTLVDGVFLLASLSKIPNGGYWSIIIASLPFLLILIYVNGQKRLASSLKFTMIDDFAKRYEETRRANHYIRGTALYFLREVRLIPPYIVHNMLQNHIIYEDNILIVINTTNEPYGLTYQLCEPIAEGLRALEITKGYNQLMAMTDILINLEVSSKVIFYGIEEIVTTKFFYRIFGFIKRNTPSFVKFFHLPVDKVHGVITRVEI